jgi:hypothetical protein
MPPTNKCNEEEEGCCVEELCNKHHIIPNANNPTEWEAVTVELLLWRGERNLTTPLPKKLLQAVLYSHQIPSREINATRTRMKKTKTKRTKKRCPSIVG